MVIVYAITALVGGFASCVLLWPFGAAVALLSMPFGGSLFALLAAFLVSMQASSKTVSSSVRAVSMDQPQNLQATESRHSPSKQEDHTLRANRGMTRFRDTTAISELTSQPISTWSEEW